MNLKEAREMIVDVPQSLFAPAPIETLVAEFVNHLGVPAALDEENSPQIIFNVAYEGVRYILLRCIDLQQKQPANLSPREQEIVRMLTKGLQNKNIAQVLEISPHTVATYMKRIFAKLGVNSRTEIIIKTLLNNLW